MTKPKGKAFSDVKWVNIELTEKQGNHMREVYADVEKLLSDWQNLVESGYKVTVSEDKYNACFSAYVIPVGEEHPNKGHILSARAGDILKAVRGALFRHYVLFDGVWTDHERQTIDAD